MPALHYNTRTRIPNSRRWLTRRGLAAACLVAGLLAGCGQTKAPSGPVTLTVTDEGFLSYAGGGAEDEEEIERLNAEIQVLVDEYRETLDDTDRKWTVTSEITSGDRILQGTIYITKEETSLLSGDTSSRQLASFAYDTETHTGYTAQDALEADPLTGVELSTNVKQAFNVLEPGAELLTTEMQGFVLNDDATTEFIYMRIESDADPEDGVETPIEQFYLYDPSVDAMAALDWPTN